MSAIGEWRGFTKIADQLDRAALAENSNPERCAQLRKEAAEMRQAARDAYLCACQEAKEDAAYERRRYDEEEDKRLSDEGVNSDE